MSDPATVGVLVVGVGRVPVELVAAAEKILGPLHGVAAECFAPDAEAAAVEVRLQRAAATVDQGRGVLIIADLCGSTLANAAYRLAEERPDCEVLCGANLPMLMKLYAADRRGLDALGLGEALAETGRRGINLCSEQRCGEAAVRAALAEGDEP